MARHSDSTTRLPVCSTLPPQDRTPELLGTYLSCHPNLLTSRHVTSRRQSHDNSNGVACIYCRTSLH